MSNLPGHLYEFGPFRLDTAERLLLRDEKPVALTPKTFDTLVVLVARAGRLVEREELMRALWPDSIVEEGNLSVTISMLRKALGAGRDENRYIETVSKRGYRFAVSIREVQRAQAGEDRTTAEIVRSQPRATTLSGDESAAPEQTINRSDSARPGRLRLAASVLVAGVVITISLVWLGTRKDPAVIGDTARLAVKSVAVLPFKALGANSTDEYVGLGMADTLISKLGNTGQIVVRPTSAVMKYKDSGADPQAAGREQGVDAVLDGHIQREGERMRVTVQLIRVNDGAELWADSFDEKFTNIFAVQDAISERAVQAIRLQLTGEEKRLLTKRFTENSEAYQAYVRGRFFWSKRTEEGLNKGAEYFRQAIALDGSYAQAYAGLADSYSMLGIYTVLSPRDAYPQARQVAKQALDIDGGLAEAHASLGVVSFYYDWNGRAAEDYFNRAFQINPNYAVAHMWYGLSLTAMGRLSEASAEMKRAQEIDPLSLIINANIGWPLHIGGQYDQAIEAYRKAIEMDPSFARAHFRLGLAFEQKGLYEQAIAEFQKASNLSGGNPEYALSVGHAYAVSGKTAQARKVLEEMKRRSTEQYVPPYGIALIYLGLGDKDRAFEWLEKALEDHSSGMIYMKVDPMLNSLRADARFVKLEQHVGF